MLKFGRLLWIIISLLMVGLTTSFTVSNDAPIDLSLWPFSQTLRVPTWLAIVSAFIMGGILGAVVMWGHLIAIRAKLWRFQSQTRKLQTKQSRTSPKQTLTHTDEE